MEGRPVDLVGIFERALSLYAHSFARFAAIAIAAIAPVAVAQYAVLLRERPELDATLTFLRHPDRLRTEHGPTLFDSPLVLALVIASVLFGYYMLAFAFGAIAAGVARRNRGDAVEFRACYEPVIRRWPAIVAIVGLAILALVGAYVVAIVLLAIPIFAAAAFAARSFGSIAAFAIAGMAVAIFFTLLCILVTSACAVCAVTVEGLAAPWSVRLTLARVLNRKEFGRAMLCAVAVAAIGLTASTLVDTGALLWLARWPLAYEALDAAERVVVVPFLGIVLVVYYFDVRLRYEGLGYDARAELVPPHDEPVYAPTAYLSGEERALVKRFLERRDSLAPQRRREIAAALAEPARARVPPELRALDDESLLERL